MCFLQMHLMCRCCDVAFVFDPGATAVPRPSALPAVGVHGAHAFSLNGVGIVLLLWFYVFRVMLVHDRGRAAAVAAAAAAAAATAAASDSTAVADEDHGLRLCLRCGCGCGGCCCWLRHDVNAQNRHAVCIGFYSISYTRSAFRIGAVGISCVCNS